MRRFSIIVTTLLLPTFLLVASPGCGKKDKSGDGGGDGDGKPPEKHKPRVALKADSFDGTIKGYVELDGTPPPRDVLADIKKTDVKACREAPEDQQINQTWIVDPKTKRVANVLVFLRPPDGKYFPFDKDKITFEKEVHIDQPFCAFVPHVSAVFPVYYDGKS